MPRAYTEAEQAAIRARLLAEGERRFAEHGLHAVTIRALTQAAGIGKGSFYLFFDSKEALFFAIQEHLETRFKAELQQELEALPPDPAALIEHLVLASMARMETHPFLHHLADPEVLGALMQRLPPAVLQAHRASDQAWFLALFRRWIEAGTLPEHTDPQQIFTVLAATFTLAVNRELVGPGWRDAARLMARGLAAELAEGPPPARSPAPG